MTPVLSRRGSLAANASLVVPLAPPLQARAAAEQEITDWIAIAPDGAITLSQLEVGQGSYTVLPQILADELDADWQCVRVRFVTGRDAYKIAFKNEPLVGNLCRCAAYVRIRAAIHDAARLLEG